MFFIGEHGCLNQKVQRLPLTRTIELSSVRWDHTNHLSLPCFEAGLHGCVSAHIRERSYVGVEIDSDTHVAINWPASEALVRKCHIVIPQTFVSLFPVQKIAAFSCSGTVCEDLPSNHTMAKTMAKPAVALRRVGQKVLPMRQGTKRVTKTVTAQRRTCVACGQVGHTATTCTSAAAALIRKLKGQIPKRPMRKVKPGRFTPQEERGNQKTGKQVIHTQATANEAQDCQEDDERNVQGQRLDFGTRIGPTCRSGAASEGRLLEV